jgi:hypothetical protein
MTVDNSIEMLIQIFACSQPNMLVVDMEKFVSPGSGILLTGIVLFTI